MQRAFTEDASSLFVE